MRLESWSAARVEEPDKGKTGGSKQGGLPKSPVIHYDSSKVDLGALRKQAAEIEKQVALLEQSQRVTHETMNLEFTI